MSNPPNKVAIVTGSASGIGRAIALHLAKDGFDVVFVDLEKQIEAMEGARKEAQKVNKEGKFVAATCDVSKEDQVQNLVDDVVKEFGRLDCVSALITIQ